MQKQHALDILRRSKPELQTRFGVIRLALFGSTARDVATINSDVDVLVAFDGPATSKRYFGVQFFWRIGSAILSISSRKKRCGRNCGR